MSIAIKNNLRTNYLKYLKGLDVRSAIIGMGEVGCTLYEALLRGGLTITHVADKKPSQQAIDLCRTNSVTVANDAKACVGNIDLILSCVEGETAALIAKLVAEHGHEGQVLVDFSTASADTKRQASASLAERGIQYIDIAIMGSIALTGAKTRMIAAGIKPDSPSSKAVDSLTQAGLNIKVIADSHTGDAISLKLLRSIFTKGLEALTTECLSAAEHLGVRQALYDVLSDVDQTHLPDFLEMLVSTHLVHAARRKKEVDRAHEQLQELGLDSLMLPAVSAVFDRTERLHDRKTTPTPPSLETALAILTRLAQHTEPKDIA